MTRRRNQDNDHDHGHGHGHGHGHKHGKIVINNHCGCCPKKNGNGCNCEALFAENGPLDKLQQKLEADLEGEETCGNVMFSVDLDKKTITFGGDEGCGCCIFECTDVGETVDWKAPTACDDGGSTE